jgi:hypothetical protein
MSQRVKAALAAAVMVTGSLVFTATPAVAAPTGCHSVTDLDDRSRVIAYCGGSGQFRAVGNCVGFTSLGQARNYTEVGPWTNAPGSSKGSCGSLVLFGERATSVGWQVR